MTKKETEILGRIVSEEVTRTMNKERVNEAKRRRESKLDHLTECAMKRIQRKGGKINRQDIAEAIVKTLKESQYGTSRTPEQVYDEYMNMRSHSFISPDESCELGVVYDPKTNQLYSGFISNSGCNKQWVIDYDMDFSMDENLQTLYDKIYDEWDWDNQ